MHRGKPLAEVPTRYLAWVLREVDVEEGLGGAIVRELARRRERLAEAAGALDPEPAPAGGWPGLLSHWYHDLARDYHPDVGGSVEGMRAINDAADRLRRLLAAEG